MRKFDESLPMALHRAREATMAFFRPVLNAAGVTEQQWRVIRVLHERDELESRTLAEIACILPPSLTGILARLEGHGLVRRRKDVADQRRLFVSLTPRGQARFRAISAEVEQGYAAIEAKLGRRCIDQLFELLHKVRDLAPEDAPPDRPAAEFPRP